MREPSTGHAGGSHDARRISAEQGRLIAAYCDGLGLASVTIVADASGIRIVAAEQREISATLPPDVAVRWWCRNAAQAEWLVLAAGRRLSAGTPSKQAGSAAAPRTWNGQQSQALSRACSALSRTAAQLGVVLHSDAQISEQALAVAVRIEGEMEVLQRRGELKSVNAAYRTYRLEASARGETVQRYAQWMSKYKENLVRALAATLKSF
jgi:hypothetical protein